MKEKKRKKERKKKERKTCSIDGDGLWAKDLSFAYHYSLRMEVGRRTPPFQLWGVSPGLGVFDLPKDGGKDWVSHLWPMSEVVAPGGLVTSWDLTPFRPVQCSCSRHGFRSLVQEEKLRQVLRKN